MSRKNRSIVFKVDASDLSGGQRLANSVFIGNAHGKMPLYDLPPLGLFLENCSQPGRDLSSVREFDGGFSRHPAG